MIETERLVLRRWTDADRAPLAAIHADPEVMQWLGGVATRQDSDVYMDRYEAHFDKQGFGLWAIERKADAALLGVAGVRLAPFAGRPSSTCFEIAWRLARFAWGGGYMTEAAGAALQDSLTRQGVDEVLAWTATTNLRSQAVMQRIGMLRDPARDFDQTALPEGDPLRPHVVYSARP